MQSGRERGLRGWRIGESQRVNGKWEEIHVWFLLLSFRGFVSGGVGWDFLEMWLGEFRGSCVHSLIFVDIQWLMRDIG